MVYLCTHCTLHLNRSCPACCHRHCSLHPSIPSQLSSTFVCFAVPLVSNFKTASKQAPQGRHAGALLLPLQPRAMASLTSARARNRGVSGSPAVHDSQHETGQFQDIVDDEDGDKKFEKPYRSLHQPSSSTAHKKATPSHSLRPFGSSAHVPAANAAATSGWVTSGTYVDKGKGKAGSNTIAKTGNGPLRAYGGGLGSVGQGEFKLLVMIVALASVVRLWKLDRPSSVVFDEVHFGGEYSAILSRVCVKIDLSFSRRLRDKVHQATLLYGCPSSTRKAYDYIRSLVCWIPWKF